MIRRWFDLSVGQKLAVGALIMVALVTVVAVSSITRSARVRALHTSQVEVIAPRAQALDALERAILYTAVALRSYALSASPASPASPAGREACERAVEVMRRVMVELGSLPREAEGQGLFQAIARLEGEYRKAADAFVDAVAAGADSPGLRSQEQLASQHRERLLDEVRAFAGLQARQVAAARSAVVEAADDMQRTAMVAALFMLAAAGITAAAVARSVRRPAVELASAAHALGLGDYAPALALAGADRAPGALPYRDELRQAAAVFGRMAHALRQREERLAALARLSGVLGRSLDPRRLATDAVREVMAYENAEAGGVYLLDEAAGELRPIGSTGFHGGLPPAALGEGLAGEAAEERRLRIARELATDTPFRIRAETGGEVVAARELVASPMLAGDRVIGVLVIATLGAFRPEGPGFAEEAAGQLAVSLDNALAHARVEDLAGDLREKNDQLQAQNEQLQAQSEELQAQGEELQQQNEELQSQAEELQAQAEELQTQTEEVQQQSSQLEAHRGALQTRNEELAMAARRTAEFLAVLGHELRNPLGAISTAATVLGRLDGARGGGANGEVGQVQAVIARQARHLTRLVDDLLDVARVSSGKVLLSRRPLDVGEAVTRAVETLEAVGRSRAHDVVVLAASVWIDGDETRIDQIATNLLVNALKYTPAGGRITVSAAREGDEAVLRVEDTGAGIPADLLPRIFEPFVQGDRSADRSQGGLGVGLTLVKHLVELHGGTVRAASAGPGHGATFSVRLPAVSAPAPMAVAAPSDPGERRSVLVVEDNADARAMLTVLLTSLGHEAHEAHDGPSAIAQLTALRPAIALVDLGLPGFDGCEVARRIRQDPGAAGLYLVALTGYGQPEDTRRAMDAGFDVHLVKPVDIGRLTVILGAGGRAATARPESSAR